MISSDPKFLDENSSVRKRILEYGQIFDHLHVFLIARTGTYKKEKINEKVSLTVFPSIFKLPGLINAFFESSAYKGEIDYVTVQDPFELGFFGYLISKKLKTKIQIQIHTDVGNKYFIFQNPINFCRFLMFRFLAKRADSVRVVSQKIKNEVIKTKTSAHISVLPIFVDIDQIESTKVSPEIENEFLDSKEDILMVSRLTSEKDFSTALRAFKLVSNKKPNAKLIIVGDGPKKKFIKRKISQLNLSGRVELRGFTEDVISYFKSCDVYLLTSKYEGYSMSLIEASASRIPIVTTDVGIVGDYLINDQSALVCPVKGVECLAQNMITLLENRDLAYSLYMSAIRSVSQKAINKYNYLEKFKETFAS